MNIEDIIDKRVIISWLKEYSYIPSLTGFEYLMLDSIKDTFKPLSGQSFVRIDRDNHLFKYALLWDKKKRSSYLFTIHLDRVPDYTGRAYVNTIVSESSEGLLTGQLDNIIGIVILRYLHNIGYPMNILFTTREETCDSWIQIEEALNNLVEYADYKLIPVSLDIDIFGKLSEFDKTNAITLRSKDNIAEMDLKVVKGFRKIAKENDIPFTEDELGSAIVEPGFLAKNTNNVWKGVHIGIPLINYHSDRETTTWEVVYNSIRFIEKILINSYINKLKEK